MLICIKCRNVENQQKSKEKKCWIENITERKYFWINRIYLGIESGHKNWAEIFDKYDAEKQKYRYGLMPKTKFQPCRRFVRNGLAERKIRSRRLAPKQFLEFKEKLVLDPKELRNIVLMNKVF